MLVSSSILNVEFTLTPREDTLTYILEIKKLRKWSQDFNSTLEAMLLLLCYIARGNQD